ncbi:MAG: hypothetical protein IPJ11_10855 [Gemmatimonadetes bacterium]|nr:hypothetical protein [Gemmatimonadota bacterium]
MVVTGQGAARCQCGGVAEADRDGGGKSILAILSRMCLVHDVRRASRNAAYQGGGHLSQPTFLPAQRDWIDWTGFVVSIVGTSITLFALRLTYKEAKAATSAAAAARAAADRATSAISERVTIADLAALRTTLGTIVSLLEAKRSEAAVYEVRQVRQRLVELRERRGFAVDKTEVQVVVTDLAHLQQVLETSIHIPTSPHPNFPAISKQLSQHIDRFVAWAEQLRFEPEGSHDAE